MLARPRWSTRWRRRAPGWVRAGPRGLVARDRVGPRAAAPVAGPPVGIGLSGQMHGLVALDSADQVLRPAILWNDQRTAAQCRGDRADDRPGAADRADRQPGAARLHRPEAAVDAQPTSRSCGRRLARVMLPKDYVRLRLCGEHATDVSDASGTLLLDVAARRWSADVLDALELDARLPARGAREPGGVGNARRDGVPVAAGAGDQAAGALGVGVARPGPLSIVLGTSGVVFAACERVPQRPARPAARLLPRAAIARWHVMGVMLSAAGSLGWARDVLAPGTGFDRAAGGCRGLAARGRGADLPALSGRRAHARTSIRTPARRSRGWDCATTGPRWSARCSRAWPSGCATPWT